MKYLIPLALSFILAVPLKAEASHRRHYLTHHFGRHLAMRHFHHAHRRYVHVARRYYGGDCARAAALGGPCGCVAMGIVGLTDRKFWLARNWLLFPRTEPHVGAAAVWRTHSHVEIVAAVNHDGTVTTRGSVGHSHVPVGVLTFVEPHRHRGIWPT
jgi:hypothetical protein